MKMQSISIRLTLAAAGLTGLTLVSGCCTKSSSAAYYPPYQAQGAAETPQETQISAAPAENLAGQTNIPLYKENLQVGTRQVPAGTVTIKKIVKTETVNQPVELRHEEVVVERQPSSGEAANQDMSQAFQEGETTIQLSKDEPVVQKQIVPDGQAVVKTTSQTEQRNIQAQLRSEDVVTSREGAAAGGAESPEGQTSGASGTITDPAALSASDAGRQCQFSNLKVQNIMGDHVAVLSAPNGQSLYVFSPQGVANIKAGDSVNVTGTCQTGSANVSGDAAQILSSQPMYISAQQIQPAGQ